MAVVEAALNLVTTTPLRKGKQAVLVEELVPALVAATHCVVMLVLHIGGDMVITVLPLIAIL
jgi:hypothetical protein